MVLCPALAAEDAELLLRHWLRPECTVMSSRSYNALLACPHTYTEAANLSLLTGPISRSQSVSVG